MTKRSLKLIVTGEVWERPQSSYARSLVAVAVGSAPAALVDLIELEYVLSLLVKLHRNTDETNCVGKPFELKKREPIT